MSLSKAFESLTRSESGPEGSRKRQGLPKPRANEPERPRPSGPSAPPGQAECSERNPLTRRGSAPSRLWTPWTRCLAKGPGKKGAGLSRLSRSCLGEAGKLMEAVQTSSQQLCGRDALTRFKKIDKGLFFSPPWCTGPAPGTAHTLQPCILHFEHRT